MWCDEIKLPAFLWSLKSSKPQRKRFPTNFPWWAFLFYLFFLLFFVVFVVYVWMCICVWLVFVSFSWKEKSFIWVGNQLWSKISRSADFVLCSFVFRLFIVSFMYQINQLKTKYLLRLWGPIFQIYQTNKRSWKKYKYWMFFICFKFYLNKTSKC